MIKFILFTVIALVIFRKDYASIKKQKDKKEKRVYISTFFLGYILVSLLVLEVNLPNPSDWIKQAYQPILEPYINSLKSHKLLE